MKYDVLVIGSGPGGYIAAIRAAQLGLKTAIVEREHLGGICLNWGCIPTKALLRSAEVKHLAENAANYGLTLDGTITADIAAIVSRSRGVSARLNKGVGFLLKKNQVDVIWGEAKLLHSHNGMRKIEVSSPKKQPMQPQNPVPNTMLGEAIYEAKHVIIATGAKPRFLPGLEPDGKLVWSYFEAMIPAAIPRSVIILGSGAIGIEFASFYSDMGAKVTIVEVLPQILSAEDAEISSFVRKNLEKRGVQIFTETKLERVEKREDGIDLHVTIAGKKQQLIQAEKLISAIGVEGNIHTIGLEEAGVKTDRGCIVVDEWGQTNISGIYAIGDVAGPPMLAHKAEEEGVRCVEKIAAIPNVMALDKHKIPACTYCRPQIASVGLSEEKARKQNYEIRVGRYSFSANGKAIAQGEDQGLIKVIFDKTTGQLLGAHMVGTEVTELIQGFVVAMNLETTEEELIHSIFPHPTLSEMMKESVLDAYGKVLNA